MKLFVVNGPNINMLGIREKEIYGTQTYDCLVSSLKEWAIQEDVELEIYQSNIEGEIVNFIQKAYFEKADGIIINPAAYTHTSIAILDALKATNIPAIEVHITDISTREDFRKVSFSGLYCFKTIKGEGFEGYHKAIIEMKKYVKEHANGTK